MGLIVMSKKPIKEESFLHSRVTSALRTGWACLIAGLLVQFSNIHVQWMAFPIFSYVVAIVIVGESTLGKALQEVTAVIIGTFQGVGMGILAFQLIDLHTITLGTSVLCISLSSFVIVYPNKTHVLSKRVALAQTAIIYISAFIQKGNFDSVLFPLRLGGTTTIGATCGMLAVLFPIPHLATTEVQKQSKLACRIICERLRIIVEAFFMNHVAKSTSLSLQANSLAKIEANAYRDITEKKGDTQWELTKYSVRGPHLEHFLRGLDGLEKHVLGIDMALQCQLKFPRETPINEILKDSLIFLTDWLCVALRHASSIDFDSSTCHSLRQFIDDEGNKALKTFEEALATTRQKLKRITHREARVGMGNAPQDCFNASEFIGCKDSFQSELSILFFLFNIERFIGEMQLMLCNLQNLPQKKLKHKPTLGKKFASIEKSGSEQLGTEDRGGSPAPDNGPRSNDCSVKKAESVGNCVFCQNFPQKQGLQNNPTPGNQWNKLVRWPKYKPNAEQLRTCLKLSLSMAIAACFGALFNRSRGYWASITVGLGFGNVKGNSFKISNLRAQGAVIGTVYGLLALLVTRKTPYLRLAALIPWVLFTSFLRQSKLYEYSGSLSAFVSALVVLCRRQRDSDEEFIIIRIVEVFLGMASYIIVEMIVLPKRAASDVREEVVAGLENLRIYTTSVLSAYTRQQCEKCRSSIIEDLKLKDKSLRSLISRQNALVKEAVDEPAFWFPPFPGSNYSKLVSIQGRIVDLLLFAVSSLEVTVRIFPKDPVSVQKLHHPLRQALSILQEELVSTIEFLEKVLQIDFPEALLQFDSSNSVSEIHDFDMENQCHETASEKKLSQSSPGHSSCREYDRGDKRKRFRDEFEKGFNETMDDLPRIACHNNGEISGDTVNNRAVLCVGAVGFIMEGVLEQTWELEKAVKELLQAQNPWSLIEFPELK